MTDKSTVNANQIVDTIRATFRGVHIASVDDAVELIESYAKIKAGEASIAALKEAYARGDRALADLGEALAKDLSK